MSKELEDGIYIDLLELIVELFRKLHIIILVGVLFAVLAYLGTNKLSGPTQYTSTTKMQVSLKLEENIPVSYRGNEYSELILSSPILEKVINQLELEMSTEKLKSVITVETLTETRILAVSVKDPNPQMAKEIVDTVREIAVPRIEQIADVESVDLVEEGNLPEKGASSANLVRNVILGGLLGCLLVAGIIFLRYIFGTTIKTPADVERYLGINVLAVLPRRK